MNNAENFIYDCNCNDRSCIELKTYIHCRNCPKYSIRGRALFNREFPNELKREWTNILSLPKEVLPTEIISVLIFRLKSSWLAILTNCFREAVEIKLIHSVPFRTNKNFKGIVSIHGELYLCFSASDILEIIDENYDEKNFKNHQRLVVLSKENDKYVFTVDEILGVERILPSQIQKTPSTISKSAIAITKGSFIFLNKTVSLLDEEKLFHSLEKSLQF